jgi:hypothetical protein
VKSVAATAAVAAGSFREVPVVRNNIQKMYFLKTTSGNFSLSLKTF